MKSLKDNPVLLIPGFYSDVSSFDKLSNYLTKLKRQIHILDLMPNTGELELEYLSQQAANFINKTFDVEESLDIVGFSMGGIISRYYIQKLGGKNRIQRLITVAAPHYGTWAAFLCNRPACIQLRPGSKFLQKLNSDIADLEYINCTSIWSPFDFIVFPADNSKLPIGRNINVPVYHHASIVEDNRVFQEIDAALKQPLKKKYCLKSKQTC
jgi:triacylglycerol lipase